jgi:hypothetical protein
MQGSWPDDAILHYTLHNYLYKREDNWILFVKPSVGR